MCWVFFVLFGCLGLFFACLVLGLVLVFCWGFFGCFRDCSNDSRICPAAEMAKVHVLNVFYNKEEVSNRKQKDVGMGICRW